MQKLDNFIPVKGYEDKYLVNNLGQLYSIRNKIILKPMKNQRYNYYSLMDKMNKKNILVHRLVASHFIPNPNNKPFVNHINGLREDNRAINLEWCTHKENISHAWATGLCTKEQRMVGKKLNKMQVEEIRTLSKNNTKGTVIAKMYNVTKTTISNIINNKQWL